MRRISWGQRLRKRSSRLRRSGVGGYSGQSTTPLVKQIYSFIVTSRTALFTVLVLASATVGAGAVPGVGVGPGGLVSRYLPEGGREVRTPAYFGVVDVAGAQIGAGQYRRGLYTLYSQPGDDAGVAVLRSRAHAVLGEGAAAVADLGGEKLKGVIGVELQRARLLKDGGDFSGAVAVLSGAGLAENVQGRLMLGQVLEEMGDYAGALKAYSFFARYLDAPPTPEITAWDLVAIGRGLDRQAALTSAYRNNPALDNLILSTFVRAYDVVDREGPANVEAHLAAAEYLLSHDKPDEAAEELKAALKANPRSPEAWLMVGGMGLEVFDFDRVDTALAHLREVNPASLEADLLAARSYLHQRRPALAEPLLDSVLKRQPRHLAALGLLASVQALKLDEGAMTATLGRADAISPTSPVAYEELADQLGQMRQYPRAAAMYQVAMGRAPWWTTPRNNLGLLYTQSGDEDLARATLDEAHALDPFNIRSTNYLRLLDRLAKLATTKGPHFEIRTDATADPFLGPLLLEYMESVNADLEKIFNFTPAVTTYIEVFPTHAQFSVRTTGNPWIGTVGASTGRVIALVAPRQGAATMGTYNWAQVLRHEYTHTITLGATENRIPHWMTEGLAVWAEQSPLRWEWVPMLYSAVTKDELFTMDRLTWGFVRPKRPMDRQLAYAQSFWMCRYLIETYGRQSMLDMLAAFKAGQSEAQAFSSVIHRTPNEFHAEFVVFAKKEVATWGYDKASVEKYDALRETGESQIEKKELAAAVVTWEQIAALRPVDALPHQRLAGLYLSPAVNDKAKARAHLEALNAVELKDNRFAKRLVKLAMEMDDWPGAMKYAQQAIRTNPYDAGAHQLLLELAEKQNNAGLVALQKERLKQLGELEARREKDNDVPPGAKTAPVEPG